MWSRQELKSRAKEALSRNYWKAVLVSLFLLILSGGLGNNFKFNLNDSYSMGRFDAGNSSEYESARGFLEANGFEGVMKKVAQEISQPDRFVVIAIVIVVVIVIMLFVLAIALTIDAFLLNPLRVGIKRFFVQDLDNKAAIRELAYGFDNHYMNIVVNMFFKNLFIFFWTLLFIIPGIIKAYEYRMIVYILGENPDMERHTAFALSKEMMSGQKWNAFVLDLSFIGWNILSIFTLGLLSILYVAPYQYHTNAALYDSLKKGINNGTIQQETVIN